MNRNEFENWMKDKAEEQQFLPSEDLWLKLHADLQKPAAGKKTAFFLPWMKIAASVLIILSLGVATTYFIKDNDQQDNAIVANKKQNNLPQQTNSHKQNTTPEPNTPTTNNIAKILPNVNNKINKTFISVDTYVKPQQNDNLFFKNKEETPAPEIAQTNKTEPKNQKEIFPENKHKYYTNTDNEQANADRTLYAKNNKGQQAINLGMSANIGKSSISDVAGYQVGVVGRGNISKRIFLEAGISVASNTVSYSNQHSFPGVEMGSDGLANYSNNTTTNVQANYSRNIISVGVTPSVGIKVTKKLSLSTGGALYRNLNPSLELTNESDIENAALSKDIISTSQKVSNWDIGVTCNADYKVTKNLSFNINYRKGITDYLQRNNKYEKNSGVQLGLKFLFGK